jgi:hypothetical protein
VLEVGVCFLEEGYDVAWLGDISLDGDGLAAELFDGFDDLGALSAL